MAETFPPPIGAPAGRALANAGITSFAQLATWSEKDLLALHGMGPKAARLLRAALAENGLSFAESARRADEAPAPPAPGVAAVDDYLAAQPAPAREALGALRETLRRILPHAEERMQYGMPTFAVGGTGVAGYAGHKAHCSYSPMSGAVLSEAGAAVARYETSKGALRFGFDQRLPIALVRRLVKLRLAEIAAVENGMRIEYYDDGQRKAAGPMRAGAPHGAWEWFRRDGSLLRTGTFDHGTQVGTWTTWDRAGAVVTRSTP